MIEPENLAQVSSHLTERSQRFGEYSTHELGIQPAAYGPKLDVDFTRSRTTRQAGSGAGEPPDEAARRRVSGSR
ncbi:hypothetical protein SLV14_001360 [Streptomyces sp. Je 1-4]|uniref:hypothetical protein n=1 Tax=Streptomyces TaxID=1883 RepID=UPI0021D8F352|nr:MULTISPECIES: hypothetical protein [unclassified Streptomyces]UYB38941.1 hypothetical protein SLV14_001360 [Streptomyces sp. Je 1-4]UZQ34935.1 hypothetical protein SLV14N_001360 [Streptomyces sp. Je 1-4] [Streptomyces sp. Je 1-4 4N24]UZQ42353.1 hypothetical protein SLV14NA_001360 [Streptomyces sp. Je 1-4] [Streptomyces sp. Je 1-4 4N24_ara]